MARTVRYGVELSEAERAELRRLIAGGKAAARRVKRAQILLAADAGRCDEEIAASVGVGTSTVYRTRRRRVEGNLAHALAEAVRPGAQRKLSGNEEALLVATACSSPPPRAARAGRSCCWPVRWCGSPGTRRSPARRYGGASKRTKLKPWRKDRWCIPRVDGEFVARMEDVLDLYAETPDATRPVVNDDESPTQLIGEVRAPSRPGPGSPSATIASTGATEPRTCSSRSTCIGRGDM